MPFTFNSPSKLFILPKIILSKVDFPLPLGPKIAYFLPFSNLKDKLSKIFFSSIEYVILFPSIKDKLSYSIVSAIILVSNFSIISFIPCICITISRNIPVEFKNNARIAGTDSNIPILISFCNTK